jgi:hypothetical protein
MKLGTIEAHAGSLTDEVLNLLLDEAEQALLTVDARADEPGRRIVHGDVPDRDVATEDVSELRLAIAELVDAYPSFPHDLETIGERLRNVGANAGAEALESHPQVLDLVRMSLEIFFRLHPDEDEYEASQRKSDNEDLGPMPHERYDAYAQLLEMLRSRVC